MSASASSAPTDAVYLPCTRVPEEILVDIFTRLVPEYHLAILRTWKAFDRIVSPIFEEAATFGINVSCPPPSYHGDVGPVTLRPHNLASLPNAYVSKIELQIDLRAMYIHAGSSAMSRIRSFAQRTTPKTLVIKLRKFQQSFASGTRPAILGELSTLQKFELIILTAIAGDGFKQEETVISGSGVEEGNWKWVTRAENNKK